MKSLKLTILLGIAFAAMNLPASAGPGSRTYVPLRSKEEISALKPGSQVAHECPHCKSITISKVGRDKSFAEGFSCPECKMKISYRATGGGKGPKLALIDCVDVKTGKKMTARVCALHK